MSSLYVPVSKLNQDNTNERIQTTVNHFRSHFKKSPQFVVRVPGRVNLIGEHIDYCGYAVLPMAVEKDIVLAVATNHDHVLNLTNIERDLYHDHTCAAKDVVINQPPKWHDYFLSGYKGVIEHIKLQSNNNLLNFSNLGLDIAASGSLPPSSGLSSSSALVCAAAVATQFAVTRDPIDKAVMADLCAAAERFVGTQVRIVAVAAANKNCRCQGGGMDQAIAFLAEAGDAKLIEFVPKLTAHNVRLPAGSNFFVTHSGAECNKAATNYFNIRVLEVKSAAVILAHYLDQLGGDKTGRKLLDGCDNVTLGYVQAKCGKSLPEMVQLANSVLKSTSYSKSELLAATNVQTEDQLMRVLAPNNPAAWSRFQAAFAATDNFKLRDRTVHVFEEAARVHEFKRVCDSDIDDSTKVERLGQLMDQSHASCKDLYECSCVELDRAVEMSKAFGAKGARLTGAGWGGCMVALVDERDVQSYADKMDSCAVNKSFTFNSKPGSGVAIYTL